MTPEDVAALTEEQEKLGREADKFERLSQTSANPGVLLQRAQYAAIKVLLIEERLTRYELQQLRLTSGAAPPAPPSPPPSADDLQLIREAAEQFGWDVEPYMVMTVRVMAKKDNPYRNISGWLVKLGTANQFLAAAQMQDKINTWPVKALGELLSLMAAGPGIFQ